MQVISLEQLHAKFHVAGTSKKEQYTHRASYLIDKHGVMWCPICKQHKLVSRVLDNLHHLLACINVGNRRHQHEALYRALTTDQENHRLQQLGELSL